MGHFDVSIATAQGERDHQEDRIVKEQIGSGWLLAVFDGHGGAETSDKASQALVSLFKTHLQAEPGNIPKTLSKVFESLTTLTKDQRSGSTASVVYIPENAATVYLAVLGDSPVAILDAKGSIHIGPDHNVRTNLKERAAAEALGGVYTEGYLEDSEVPNIGLQMARSLGDVRLARVLNREPEIKTITLGGKGIVLVGTDGLLLSGGPSNTDQLKRLLGLIQQGQDAAALIKDALARRTGDNVSAIVWHKD